MDYLNINKKECTHVNSRKYQILKFDNNESSMVIIMKTK